MALSKNLLAREPSLVSVDQDEDQPGSVAPSLSENDLATTVGAFESRIQRKKKEREASVDAMGAEARTRQALMLETMATIRRSLIKVAKIDLGDRFAFTMDFDDWQGWPRLLLKLNDRLLPEADYPQFQVLAHDRLNRATIEISSGAFPKQERVFLGHAADAAKLPLALKKCVRLFLDVVEKIVLDAEMAAPVDEDLPTAEPAQPAAAEEERISADLFTDGSVEEDFLGTLPQLDVLESLSDGSNTEKS